MVTFNDAIAKTRMFLDEVSAKTWPDTEVKREVNFAYQEFVTAVVNAFEDFYLTPTAFSLVDALQEYGVSDGVPDDVYKIRRIELNYDTAQAANAFRKAMPINITQVRDSLSTSGLGAVSAPRYFTYGFETSMKLGFIPVPNVDSTNGAKLWYVQKIPNLVLITDTVNIPYADRYASGVALLAAGSLLRKGQQEELAAARYIADGQAMKSQMVEELEDRVADESKVIIDSLGMDTDFGYNL